MNGKKIFFMNFKVSCDKTVIGENLYVTGDNNSLGNWDPHKAIKLETDKQTFPLWKSKTEEIECDKDKIEYKYLIKGDQDQTKWENFHGNRLIDIKEIENMAKRSIEYTVEIKDTKFNDKSSPSITIGNFKENIQEVMETANVTKQIEYKIEEEKHENLEKFIIPKYKISSKTKDIIQTVLKGDSENKTWKDKLEFIYEFLKERNELNTKNLSIIYIYLFYINSGVIKCAEDGTHFRPNHHANVAFSIFNYLIQNMTEHNSIIIRAILKNLPSFANQYTVTVPLTRIRDIAHRNDINHELKQEIKTKLQNKLHRSASPDDLKTCEYFINKITAPGTNYSQEFVKEFKIFYDELKEFFNNLGLEKSLIKLRELFMCNTGSLDITRQINDFMKLKKDGIHKSLSKLESLTVLRQSLKEIITNELANKDSCNKSILQLSSCCEIELEDYAYVVISEYLENNFYKMSHIQESEYDKLVSLCKYSMENFIISHMKKEECQIIKDDLIKFSSNFFFDKNTNLKEGQKLGILKLKSIFERCLNLFYEIADEIANYFTTPSYELGKCFKINPHTIRVFSESFVRAHFMFQFSKVIGLLLNKIRDILKLPPYITISTGQAYGFCLHLEKLSDFIFDKDPNSTIRYIVFLKQSDGTEEIPNGISGIVLSHDLPQLSHLAIRARQNKTVFICCVDNNTYKYEFFKKYKENEWLSMYVKGDQVIRMSKEEYSEKKLEIMEKADEEDHEEHKEIQEENVIDEQYVIPIDKAEKWTCGSKCANIKQFNLIKHPDYQYETARSLAIPYNVYNSISKMGVTDNDIEMIDLCPLDDLENATHHIIEKFTDKINSEEIKVGTEEGEEKDLFHLIVEYINKNLPTNCFLAIRSSSNMEDLKKTAGAGLFDSYLGVKNTPNHIDDIKLNIIKVWASLFNYRAVLARRNVKLTSKHAVMGILVQEMINVDYSFVIHTVNPITSEDNEVYIEMAVGLGETLASPKHRGSPYRIIYNKNTKTVIIVNYASFSYYIRNGEENVYISYKDQRLTVDDDYIKDLAIRLGKIGTYLQSSLDGIPQDIEGGVVNDKIYLLQTRPQIV